MHSIIDINNAGVHIPYLWPEISIDNTFTKILFVYKIKIFYYLKSENKTFLLSKTLKQFSYLQSFIITLWIYYYNDENKIRFELIRRMNDVIDVNNDNLWRNFFFSFLSYVEWYNRILENIMFFNYMFSSTLMSDIQYTTH